MGGVQLRFLPHCVKQNRFRFTQIRLCIIRFQQIRGMGDSTSKGNGTDAIEGTAFAR